MKGSLLMHDSVKESLLMHDFETSWSLENTGSLSFARPNMLTHFMFYHIVTKNHIHQYHHESHPEKIFKYWEAVEFTMADIEDTAVVWCGGCEGLQAKNPPINI